MSLTKSEKKHRNNHYTIFEEYRCLSPKEHRFVALPHSIINHKSFTTLKPMSKVLYFYMSDYAQGEKEFTYPRRIYKNIMCNQTFIVCLEELIEHGFLCVVNQGGLCNNDSVYSFSSKWKNFNPEPRKKRITKINENKTKNIISDGNI